MLEFRPQQKHVEIVFNDKVIFDIDVSKHHSVRSIPTITKELNNFVSNLSLQQIKDYLDSLKMGTKTKLAEPILNFILRDDLQEIIMQYVEKYGFKLTEKAKTDLFITQEELDTLLVLSIRAKLAWPLFVQVPLLESEILKNLASDCSQKIGPKLFRLIVNRLTPFKHTDTSMWKFLKRSMFDNVDAYAVILLAFIQQRILITCEIDKNPIVYILSIASDCMRWMSHVTGPMYTSELSDSPIFSISQTKALTITAKLKQHILTWLKPQPLLDVIEKSTVIGPIQDIWCCISKKHLKISRFDPQTAAIVSIFCSQGLQRTESIIAEQCPYLLTVTMWIPSTKIATVGHLDEQEILREVYIFHGVNVRHLVRDEILRCKTNYLYIDPQTEGKRMVSYKSLQKDLIKFFKFYTSGIIDRELERLYETVLGGSDAD